MSVKDSDGVLTYLLLKDHIDVPEISVHHRPPPLLVLSCQFSAGKKRNIAKTSDKSKTQALTAATETGTISNPKPQPINAKPRKKMKHQEGVHPEPFTELCPSLGG